MKRLNFVLTLLLFVTSAAIAAETTAPNFQQLKADWWTHFAPEKKLTNELLQQRLDELGSSLTRLSQTFNENNRPILLPLVIQLRELADVYGQPLTPITSNVIPALPEKKSYLLSDAFSLQLDYLELNAEIEHQRSDILWRRELIETERKQQSQRKISYQEDSNNPTEKLALALTIMASRFQLELDLVKLTHLQARLDQLINKKSVLQKTLKNMAPLLTFETGDLERWKKQYQQSLENIIQIRKQAVRHITTTLGDNNDSLHKTDRELRISTEELRAARADIIVGMIELTRHEDTSDLGSLKQKVADAEALLKSQAPKQAYIVNSLSALYGWEETNKKSANEKLPPVELLALIKQQINAVKTELDLLKFSVSLTRKRMLVGAFGIEDSWVKFTGFINNGYENIHTVLATSLFEMNETPVTLMGLVRLFIIIFIAWALSKTARSGINHFSSQRASVSPSSIYALSRVLHYLILSIGVVIGLSSIGVDFTKFALLASALSIGIGFGLQTLVSNFVAGLIILFEKSLKVGDFVELESGITGEVMEINMRSTLITTNDNIDILVPNSEFINKNVTNWTMREVYRRVRVPFGVAYGSDKELVKKAALEAADNVHWTLKTDPNRKPQVWLVRFGDSSLDFELVIWLIPEAVKRPSGVQASYLWEISNKLAEHNIEIPFPQRDLHLRSGFETLINKEL
ncbi:MAG: mechanosensitive ion channel [Cycloclasticus sp.]|nr:mechanosensitive ion channel [Cycloclasticus sp.]MBQ0790643.1 mechanosensitive ion channel [Cycloclasticus sp.]